MKWKNYLRRKEIKYILLLFFSTRIILTLIGGLSRLSLMNKQAKVIYSENIWLNVWGVWDTEWYLDIAKNWYASAPYSNGYANYAFFPLYPSLMRILGKIIGNYFVTGIILSNIFLILACIFLYKLVKLESDEKTSLRSIKYLFLFPSAFILSSVLSEALFLALLIMCFYYAKKQQWFKVGICGFLLSLTRSVGVVMILPLAYEYLKSKNFKIKNIRFDSLFLLLMPVGLLIFLSYLYLVTGDFLAPVHILQSAWNLKFSNPLNTIYLGLISGKVYYSFNSVFTIMGILVLVIFYKKIGFSYFLTGILLTFLPLISGLVRVLGMTRYMLVIFPFFIILAKLTRNKYIDQAIIISMALLQGFLMVFWTNRFYLVV